MKSKQSWRRPRAIRGTLKQHAKDARKGSFTAACDYESHLMDGNVKAAARIRHATLVNWLRSEGQKHRMGIPRKAA